MPFIKNNLSKYLDQHKYPSVLFRFPVLIRILYFINLILTLRNWYVIRSLRRVERKLKIGFTFLDAGCGMGDFSIRTAKLNSKSKIIGIDYTESNVEIAKIAAKSLDLTNIEFESGDLTKLSLQNQFDLILCNSTLQFIYEDTLALANMYRLLKPKGKLLLYIPITYKRYLPWSEIIEKNYLSDYYYKYHEGFLMHRYSAFEIMGKVREQKYEIHNAEFAYGLFGALAYELYSLILAALNKSPLILTPFITICYVILIFPIQLLLMFIDFVIPKKGGNGVLITATKNEKVGSI